MHAEVPDHRPHQSRLLRQRRFAPFFCTVFLGAVNDNLLKFAVVILLTYRIHAPWLPAEVVGSVMGGVFILPSVLLSATSGQWADKMDLARLTRMAKTGEVLMTLLAAWALWRQDAAWLLVCVLLSGLHVTVFSTIKYAYLPRHLSAPELTGGNGLLEMGMFTAILLGTLLGGVLAGVAPHSPNEGAITAAGSFIGEAGALPLMVTIVALALCGRLLAQWVPDTPSLSPGLKVNWNPLAESWRNLDRIHHEPVLWLCLLGISWMWFFGAVFLSLFPVVSRQVLHAGEDIASALLVLTSLGVATGALLCERLSHGSDRDAPHLGLVLAGALGMGVFGLDLGWIVHRIAHDPGMAQVARYAWSDLARRPEHMRALFDLLVMSASIGVFSVPMYAQMQYQAEASRRARIVAANNILNAVFMLVCALFTWLLAALGWGVGAIFMAGAGLHLLVTLLAMHWQPLLWRETVAWLRRWRGGGAPELE